MPDHKKKALLLFSGGLDSTILLYWAKRHDYEVHALTIDYGQKNIYEFEAANKVAALSANFLAAHEWVNVPRGVFAGENLLTGKGESAFIPGRNLLFLSIAANRAYVNGFDSILIGITKPSPLDAPDARAPFIAAMQMAIDHGLGREITIETPLEKWYKWQWLHHVSDRMPECLVALRYTYSCYRSFPPCGKCNACKGRVEAFLRAGIADPALEPFK